MTITLNSQHQSTLKQLREPFDVALVLYFDTALRAISRTIKADHMSLTTCSLYAKSTLPTKLVRPKFAFLVTMSTEFFTRSSLMRPQPLCAAGRGASRKSPELSLLPRPTLVFVTPNGFCADHSQALRITREALKGGTSLVQIRDLHATERELLSVTETLLSTNIPPNKLSLNGLHPSKVRSLSPNLGIHVREKDIVQLLQEAQGIMDIRTVISCSVHSVGSATKAIAGNPRPTYIQVGTMYPTQSHPGKVPEGISLLQGVRNVVGPLQMLIGIGGINEENIAEVLGNGADGVAVISSIFSARDPCGAASQLMRSCQSAYRRDSV